MVALVARSHEKLCRAMSRAASPQPTTKFVVLEQPLNGLAKSSWIPSWNERVR